MNHNGAGSSPHGVPRSTLQHLLIVVLRHTRDGDLLLPLLWQEVVVQVPGILHCLREGRGLTVRCKSLPNTENFLVGRHHNSRLEFREQLYFCSQWRGQQVIRHRAEYFLLVITTASSHPQYRGSLEGFCLCNLDSLRFGVGENFFSGLSRLPDNLEIKLLLVLPYREQDAVCYIIGVKVGVQS